MKDAKKKWQLIFLSVLFGVLALSLYFAWAPAKESQANSNPSSHLAALPSNFKEGVLYFEKGLLLHGRKKEIPIAQVDPILHMEKLKHFEPGAPSSSRNMFSLSAPAVSPTLAKSTAPTGGSVPGGSNPQAVSPSGRPISPAPVVINLKYIGFKQEGLQTKRQGFFSEGGGTIFLAGEGELIANRYRVVRIQENSAEIEDIPSKSHQQLALAAP
jgi:hypothetical protein